MKQEYTSKESSINKVNYVYKHYNFPKGAVVLDYGCGKYDSCKEVVEAQEAVYLPYDPYNRDEETNNASLEYAKTKGVSYIVCANVLNVIKEEEVIQNIIETIASLCQKNTQVIISIYEGDKSGIGKPTTKGYQRHQRIYSYYKWFEPYFNVVYWSNCFICTIKDKK